MKACCARLSLLVLFVGLGCPAKASLTVPSDGSDGAFNPAGNVQVDLGLAPTGTWSQNNAANAGKGVYDPAKWAVVFKYTSVNIPAGVTVSFKNNASRAPVVWLVQGNVTINGNLNLDGKPGGTLAVATEPGPGGFRGGPGGGTATYWGAGFGWGGGVFSSGSATAGIGGSYASLAGGQGSSAYLYGNARALPLVGGSGQAGANLLSDGSGGGGAILIVAADTLRVGGAISAKGGAHPTLSGGAGGAIRLVADVLTGAGSLNARGGSTSYYDGGDGRIRLECNTSTMSATASPTASVAMPIGTTPDVWPDTSAPSVTVVSVAGVAAPADPKAGLGSPSPDISIANSATSVIRVQATNVPLTWTVSVRVTPVSGTQTVASATNVSGNEASSIWEATVAVPSGISAVQARAKKP